MSAHTAIDREIRYGARNYAPLPVVLAHGRGAHLFDVDGSRYIDMMSAYSAASFGHLHPRLVKAMQGQLARLDIVSRAFHSDNLGDFCQDLADLAGLDACLVMNTGAEAVETAIKAARRYAYDELGGAGRHGRDHRRQRQFPRAHDDDHRLFRRSCVKARFRPLRAGVRHGALRRPGGDRGVDLPPHSRRPDRADPRARPASSCRRRGISRASGASATDTEFC
ncbi:protein of unknown function [Methylocella tundrae]|uniref:Uncharacterized protein n=1 Tax=Methylocella tundrae TaxID=227605 RepID=A0A4U8Z527_METTU|nr:protein of unknown function [Methylocella tundrae]